VIAVDASAVLAVYFDEPEQQEMRRVIASSEAVISPVNHWEVLVRVHREHGRPGVERVERLLSALGVRIAKVTARDSRAAYEAFARFGKGVGGPLNLGDCFAYVLAEAEGEGLLFKGDDFPKTDVASAFRASDLLVVGADLRVLR
jgi:ribonuclease VapC